MFIWLNPTFENGVVYIYIYIYIYIYTLHIDFCNILSIVKGMAGMGTLRWKAKELWFNLRQKKESSVFSKSPRLALGLAHSPV